MMNSIPNKWIEKIKEKRSPETAPAYKADPHAKEDIDASKRLKRFTFASRQTLVKTLRGIRK